MTKEEKIKEACGKLNDKINENGWLYFGYACNGWEDVEEWLESNNLNSDENYYDMTYDQCDNGDLICVQIRPKQLQGIEDNNGWITLNNVSREIPIELDNIELFNINTDEYYVSTDTHEFIKIGMFTHWKPLEISKYPLF